MSLLAVIGNEVRFFFLLGALVAFALAALGVGEGRVRLTPIGLGLFVFPMAWDTFDLAFG